MPWRRFVLPNYCSVSVAEDLGGLVVWFPRSVHIFQPLTLAGYNADDLSFQGLILAQYSRGGCEGLSKALH
jgi:hypothetical protein